MANKILVVEDHADTRNGFAEMLRLGGYNVETAENGQQGISHAHSDQPDLIITDIMMPVMDGIEMIRRLRATSDCQSTPIIVISAFGDKALEAARAGASEVLGKPVNPSSLLNAIKSLI